MDNTNNSTSEQVPYDYSVTRSSQPAMTNIKASTNLTVEYGSG